MTTLHGSPTVLVESPCGEAFSTPEDATSHQWHCDQCAGVLERLEAELDAMDRVSARFSEPMLPGLG